MRLMADKLAFRFRIRFPPGANPRGYKDQFERSLQEQVIQEIGLECYFGGLGGGACSYGVVWREDGPLTLADRERIESWIRSQRIACCVELGELEPLEFTDLLREVADRVFDVNNLTDEDRQLAAAAEQEMLARIAQFQERTGRP